MLVYQKTSLLVSFFSSFSFPFSFLHTHSRYEESKWTKFFEVNTWNWIKCVANSNNNGFDMWKGYLMWVHFMIRREQRRYIRTFVKWIKIRIRSTEKSMVVITNGVGQRIIIYFGMISSEIKMKEAKLTNIVFDAHMILWNVYLHMLVFR